MDVTGTETTNNERTVVVQGGLTMRRKCLGCSKVKNVKYREYLGSNFYCSKECLFKARKMELVRDITCSVCNKVIGEQSILKTTGTRSFKSFIAVRTA